ncbi:von Willebrand factor D and EGF domain-containing protein-like isoform X2 [Actinia tenebrosa]|uniref:von Willebrand factor D and EGF domain-containing protein-like isoform X2 n=1 Tax=Actinia tenebrosa TaxID=6105 RepID=A0A6P8GZQ0_ACTTE|nr:von Willebrand factor D and EGF domain-containing protein-like isoform X2 [Actinia tenebrosa]
MALAEHHMLCALAIVFIAILHLVKGDPCHSYETINNPYRSTEHKWNSGEPVICDYLLTRGWYRFMSNVGGQIPTVKPKPYHCGTVAPIWMRGILPATRGQIVNTTACVNMYDMSNGCFRTHQISVKHCGDYFVYFLVPTRGCAIAYCAGNLRPCPRGTFGEYPNCIDHKPLDFPYELIPTPRVKPKLDDQPMVTMQCVFDDFSKQWNNVTFLVEWYKNGNSTLNQTVCENQENCMERAGELAHNYYRPGDWLRCQLRMKYSANPANNWTLSGKKSDYFYVGIEVFPTRIYLTECKPNTSVFITFRPTVPLVSNGFDGGLKVEAYLPRHYDQNWHQVAADTCNIFLKGLAEKRIKLKGVCDIPNQQQTDLDFHFDLSPNAHLFWVRYRLKSVKVSVKNTEHGICSSTGDPHYSTFDGRYYDFYQPGDYLMYRRSTDKTSLVEVHSRLWTCNGGVSCNCGVAIRENNDIIVLTVCNELLMRNDYTKFKAYLPRGKKIARGTHIYRTVTGSSVDFKVILSSGIRITASRSYWGMSVTIYSPKPDNGNEISGLCGNFNGDQSDEFQLKGIIYDEPNAFVEKLWIKPNESHFEVRPEEDIYPPRRTESCLCPKALNGKAYCQDTENFYEVSGNAKEVKNDMEKTAENRRRSAREYWYSDNIIDYEDRSFFVNAKDARHAFHRIRSKRSIQILMSKENATRYCQRIIEKSKAGKTCKDVPGTNITVAMIQCVTDLQLTGDTSYAYSAFDYMKNECEELSLSNISLYTNDSKGEMVPPVKILDNLCPNDCSNHGNCTNQTCICDEGFTALDCSMEVQAIPEIFGIYDGGLCDIRRRPCKKTDIFGHEFISSGNLTCHLKEFKVFAGYWSPRTAIIELPGEMTDIYIVKCQLPDPPINVGDYENEGNPAGGLLISISNDGVKTSQRQLKFVSYDSVCLDCSKLSNCTLKNDACIIRGHCFAALQPNPRDWCQQCKPRIDQYNWTLREDNYAPNITSKTMYSTILGEYLVLQFQATDLDNRPVKYSLLSSTPTGCTMSPSGLLRWNVTSNENQKFTLQVTDECEAFDTLNITVRILQCPCLKGGQCVPHPYHPRGSGQYYCNCPRGFTGANCEQNVNDCIGVNCRNGTCVDGDNNYTCRCNVGFKGTHCDQQEIRCSNHSCYTGVQCTDTNGNITCGSCPPGYSGDGKACVAETTTAATTKLSTTVAVPLTTESMNTESTTAQITTKTPTTTESMNTESTTAQTSTTEKIKTELRIIQEWKDELKNPKSRAFIQLANKLKKEIWLAFARSKTLNKVDVLSFRKGSIVAEMLLVFTSKQDDPLKLLRNRIKNGQLGDMSVDPTSLKIVKNKEDETSTEKSSHLVPILVSVAVVLAVLVLGMVIIIKWRARQQNRAAVKRLVDRLSGNPSDPLPGTRKYDVELANTIKYNLQTDGSVVRSKEKWVDDSMVLDNPKFKE